MSSVHPLIHLSDVKKVFYTDVLDRVAQLANQQVQLAHIETCVAIVFPS